MPFIKDPLELGRQSYALAAGTLNPEARRALQDIGKRYLESAEMLQPAELVQTSSPEFGRRNSGRQSATEKA
jgi:hypothetical protein